jgi:hypothetical protein
LKFITTIALLARGNLAFLFSGRKGGAWGHEPVRPAPVAPDFFGVCVASSEDPACDDYVVERLRELGLRNARVDYGYDSPGGFVDRFARRLLREGFQVGLHLAPPRTEARQLDQPAAANRWRLFLRDTFARFPEAEWFEIGSTVNRRRWSGFSLPLYLRAWEIAWEEARLGKVVLAGPNVTDFEPFYNIALLHELRRRHRLPAIHTDNLFVERATEPEAFDHKILGHALAPLLRYNTIKKAALLGVIGRWAGIERTFSVHTSWSLRRIRRVLEDAGEQQADYVARYCCLTAASGGLERVYWGPLIGQREGLIDDGTDFFPDIFHVTFYGRANGKVRDYQTRPAFRAFQAVNRLVSGAFFTRKIAAAGSLEILEFQSPTHTLHAVWSRNGDCASVAATYTVSTLAAAEILDRDGARISPVPRLFTQRPIYLRWAKGVTVQTEPRPGTVPGVRIAASPHVHYGPVENPAWRGLAVARLGTTEIDSASLLPGRFASLKSPEAKVLRDKRNRIWLAPAPWDPERAIVVKHFRPADGWRGWLQRFKPGKALRSWNGAQELIRRGLPTPRPLAWFEHPAQPRAHESYYLCEAFPEASSARHAFYAFNRGASEFLGVPASELYATIARLVNQMHQRGVFFRDLSAGNLLLRRNGNGGVECSLIDTGRARVGVKAVSIRRRLADLMRLCHPLEWEGRDQFLPLYFEAARVRFAPWMRLAFHYYDWKHRLKKQLRRRGR